MLGFQLKIMEFLLKMWAILFLKRWKPPAFFFFFWNETSDFDVLGYPNITIS